MCFDPLKAPKKIFQCSQGHFVCDLCLGKLKIGKNNECPTCRENWANEPNLPARNRLAEELIQKMATKKTESIPKAEPNEKKRKYDKIGQQPGQRVMVLRSANNYDSMHAHFTLRIQKICKLSSVESLIIANAMINACKEAFPCLNSDLRAHYLSAKMELEGLKENNNNILPNFPSKVMVSGAKSAPELWLLDFRQYLHSQLSEKVQDKQANLYSFSEIVDLIISYFSM